MKKLARILILVATLVMTLCIGAKAAAYQDFTYAFLEDGTVEITDFPETASGDVVVPDTIDGKAVTSIGDKAFMTCSNITSITLPDEITYIGNSAFAFCDSLTTIHMPETLTYLGNDAFFNCGQLRSIDIPDGIQRIGICSFENCTQLTTVIIPEGVVSIGDYAFNGCWQLTTIIIPEGMISIGDLAFLDCSSLSMIYIPSSVSIIGYYAFYVCPNLSHVYYGGSEEQWNAIDIDVGNDTLDSATIHYNATATDLMPYVDVSESAWYYDAVALMYQRGLIAGTSGATYAPDDGLTRGMMVDALYQLAGTPETSTSSFSDVGGSMWYADAVSWATEVGITNGTGDNLFSPDRTITRQEMAVMFLRYCTAFDIALPVNSSAQPTDLASISDWAQDSVVAMYQCGVLNGDTAGNFNATNTATRAQAATMFSNFLSVVEA